MKALSQTRISNIRPSTPSTIAIERIRRICLETGQKVEIFAENSKIFRRGQTPRSGPKHLKNTSGGPFGSIYAHISKLVFGHFFTVFRSWVVGPEAQKKQSPGGYPPKMKISIFSKFQLFRWKIGIIWPESDLGHFLWAYIFWAKFRVPSTMAGRPTGHVPDGDPRAQVCRNMSDGHSGWSQNVHTQV